MTLAVVKIGGSLYDMPDLGQRLRSWLTTLTTDRVLLVPGGGTTTDVIRELDRVHGLGEQVAHNLALRSLTLNAWFLAELLGGNIPVVDPQREWQGIALLDGYAFGQNAEVSRKLPACWEATSDSVAAVAASVLGASELVLLKSSAGAGLVDTMFSRLVEGERFLVRIVNMRGIPSGTEPEA